MCPGTSSLYYRTKLQWQREEGTILHLWRGRQITLLSVTSSSLPPSCEKTKAGTARLLLPLPSLGDPLRTRSLSRAQGPGRQLCWCPGQPFPSRRRPSSSPPLHLSPSPESSSVFNLTRTHFFLYHFWDSHKFCTHWLDLFHQWLLYCP